MKIKYLPLEWIVLANVITTRNIVNFNILFVKLKKKRLIEEKYSESTAVFELTTQTGRENSFDPSSTPNKQEEIDFFSFIGRFEPNTDFYSLWMLGNGVLIFCTGI